MLPSTTGRSGFQAYPKVLTGYARLRQLLEDELAEPVQSGHEAELARCAIDPVYWVNTYLVTYDPRTPDKAIPFKLFPRQVQFLQWLTERESKQENGLCEKSRDVGVSFLCAAYALHGFLFKPGYKVGFGSRKLEYVDKLGDLDSIFEKIRFMMRRLPQWMQPNGFKVREHDCFNKLLNPSNGASITGEGGDEIGRGGRAQPLDAKILTPAGWRTMGDLRVGDLVIGANGKATRITGVFPQGPKDIFRVTFSDGASTCCCDDHLWQVTTLANRKYLSRSQYGPIKLYANAGKPFMVLPLSNLRSDFLDHSQGFEEHKYQIPVVAPVEFDPVKLPIDPYILGCLLGDGSMYNPNSSVALTTGDIGIREEVSRRLPVQYALVPDGRVQDPPHSTTYRLTDKRGKLGRGYHSEIKLALKSLRLMGKDSYTKFIPTMYLRASVWDRLELLRGIMDTDGWTRKGSGASVARMSTVSRQLADGVVELVRSLGGIVKTSPYKSGVSKWAGGRTTLRKGGWELVLAMPDGMNPFKLSEGIPSQSNLSKLQRKACCWHNCTKYKPMRAVVSIELIGVELAQCISVEAEDGLYITDDFIVTHNTSVYFVDEAAFIEHPDRVDQALVATTNVRVDVSTPNGLGNPFYTKRHSGLVPVFTFHWKDDPRKNEEWATKVKAEKGLTVFAAEYDIDYSASIEGIVIPGAWVRAAVRSDNADPSEKSDPKERSTNGALPIIKSAKCTAGCDIAEEGDNLSVFIPRWGAYIGDPTSWGQLNTTQTAWKFRDLALRHLAQEIDYDSIGVGAGVKGTLDSSDKVLPFRAKAVNVGESPTDSIWPDKQTSKEKFSNLKAELWWRVRQRFEKTYEYVTQGIKHPPEEMISIPNHSQLIAELSLVLHSRTESGKIKIESKEALAKRGIKSPDFAEALILSEAAFAIKLRQFWMR